MENQKRNVLAIGVASEMRGGKDTAARFIAEFFTERSKQVVLGATGDIIRSFLALQQNPERNERKTQAQTFVALSETFGEDILHKALDHLLKKNPNCEVFIFNGVRMPQDVEYVRSFKNHKFFFIDTSEKTRFERIKTAEDRGLKEAEGITLENFRALHLRPTERFIPEIKNLPDTIVIPNEGTMEELRLALNLKLKSLAV